MTPLQVLFILLGVAVVAQWNLLLRLPQTVVAAVWLAVMTAVISASWSTMLLVERVCGLCEANAHGQLVNPSSSGTPLRKTVFMALFYPLLLTFSAGVSVTLAWRDSLLLGGVASGCVAFLEQQLEMWPRRRDLKFRVVSCTLCGFALFCTALLWSFHVTSPREESSMGSLAQFAVIMWTAALTTGLLKLLLFATLHAWHTSNVLTGRAGSVDFDPMEEVGLSIRICCSLILLVVSGEHLPNFTGILVHVVVLAPFLDVLYAASILFRFRHVVDSFPEVGTAADCVICFDPVTDSARGRQLRCGHIFHSRCLRRWLMRAARCPTCRQYVFHQENALFPVELFYDFRANIRHRGVGDEDAQRGRRPRELPYAGRSVGVQTPVYQSLFPVGGHAPSRHVAISSSPAVETALGYGVTFADEVAFTPGGPSVRSAASSTREAVIASVHSDEFTDTPIAAVPVVVRQRGVTAATRYKSGGELSVGGGLGERSAVEATNIDGGGREACTVVSTRSGGRGRKRQRDSS
ncbi:hypothetical protein, conserved [Trypanosoma brucei brucei TREU927]|uniref:RING-type domain-containing protein n=1 Tax=Trypanosoma brucei brucei (strain 927/4 GUTat10.1) TaxID=185431 RepID=Q38AM3_TRYB2|nr:hypothetical protein, conserved [Trypanosoma brucei brucei TREU927]EAN78147.1 hypothetical protein, conserved [Trypanosoma brucei brucei TREU927]